MIRLGVNIDHVATLRNARGESYPSPVQAAAFAELGGADNITCHLREDRRHIRDADVELLKRTIQVPLNFEIAATDEMVRIASSTKPHAVTLVPEKRQELTTEGGLDLSQSSKKLGDQIHALRDLGIVVSLFVEPDVKDMIAAKKLGAQAIEIHSGHYCRAMQDARTTAEQLALLKPLQEAARVAHDQGLQVHVGHGLNYSQAHWMQLVPHLEEANIGHAIVARAIYVGLTQAVREMKALLNDPQFRPSVGG
ncbi:MAG TPA: pyridoxine 5'-phosphate synthase [Oligoflexus sp.]|uniref:pyridoxine 5'-phosphate synthase n=1 Tax=Oligoflexus sp. TaxID=1971216 RepID=UPI002D7FC116|nr:pyridoxine 5'-phosphate synthase [Oligoflexus sp.]HET9237019.1 pyridoxine 5'-phosphate synthase [Oligoflexus sp.]